jgi:exodeoxyribonuclease VII small subunit
VVDWPVRLIPLSPNPEAGGSFETAFRELQRIVEQLEDGGLELERAVQLYERGTQLVQQCERIVDEAELRVTRLPAESASALSDAPAES